MDSDDRLMMSEMRKNKLLTPKDVSLAINKNVSDGFVLMYDEIQYCEHALTSARHCIYMYASDILHAYGGLIEIFIKIFLY